MTRYRLLLTALIGLSFVALTSCSEARYAAHVVKKIPLPGDPDYNVGHFKVGRGYSIKGRRYYPRETYSFEETGIASWYGPNFHGAMTANGETFDKNELTAAHKTLQLPSIIKVTNLHNGRSLILRVNDRGPFAHNRILDVSERAASLLGFKNNGTARVKIQVMPQESRQVAMAAKSGQDTRGFEVALNQRHRPVVSEDQITPTLKPHPVTKVVMSEPPPTVPRRKPLAVTTQPPPVGTAYAPPRPPTLNIGHIFVQAGSFSQEQNALNYSSQLSRFGQSRVHMARVNNTPFFRVRLGPFNDREEAQKILTALYNNGHQNAAIVVE
jgi:rare lipoprotein A